MGLYTAIVERYPHFALVLYYIATTEPVSGPEELWDTVPWELYCNRDWQSAEKFAETLDDEQKEMWALGDLNGDFPEPQTLQANVFAELRHDLANEIY